MIIFRTEEQLRVWLQNICESSVRGAGTKRYCVFSTKREEIQRRLFRFCCTGNILEYCGRVGAPSEILRSIKELFGVYPVGLKEE